ncbi:MAG TPA: methyltransferase domain-containing protein [Thermoanaerobaculia bacterium]|nr:methyltransferase domain-containing protein [Thermoanaerobaculia bacterium]
MTDSSPQALTLSVVVPVYDERYLVGELLRRVLAVEVEGVAALDYLRNHATGKPYLEVARVDLERREDFASLAGQFDTAICLNVLEHVADPRAALAHLASALVPGGRLLLYVPRGQGLYSRLDELLGHRCRYSAGELRRQLEGAGLTVESLRPFNRAGTPGWWLNGKVLRRRHFGRLQLKAFDWAVPVLRRIDRFLPWPGLGLMAVARR